MNHVIRAVRMAIDQIGNPSPAALRCGEMQKVLRGGLNMDWLEEIKARRDTICQENWHLCIIHIPADIDRLIQEVERLRKAFMELEGDAFKHAKDTIWVGPAETLSDRVCNILGMQYEELEKARTE